jgi:hypothetical protein
MAKKPSARAAALVESKIKPAPYGTGLVDLEGLVQFYDSI